MIPVTQPFMPERAALDRYIDGIYQRRWLTNNGPLVQELTARLENYLGVRNLILVANGTLALQLAFQLLEVKGEAITTPFTFAATSSALCWQGVSPRYADIDAQYLNLDPALVEQKINERTGAIVPVHVYGNPCDIDEIGAIADSYDLPVIYDAAHAFGVEYGSRSILDAGDISTLSFHATKLFHTVEGGGLIIRDDRLYEKAKQLINFGFDNTARITEVGVNAKMSELHAAMGLAVLDSIEGVIREREQLVEEYRRCLQGHVQFQQRRGTENGAYMPVLFANQEQADTVETHLRQLGIYGRRYFSPALHELDVFDSDDGCPIASDVSRRVFCLPVYAGLTLENVRWIAAQAKIGLEKA